MLRISVPQFVTAIQNAPSYAVPEMSSGTNYLINSVYKRLSGNGFARLSDLDFDAFDFEDIGSFNDLYNDIFDSENHKTSSIVNTLRQIAPACKGTAYV
jgi:2-hydroxy-3-keto-5-methylthiopentenyl-1-phosphate phosphatase